jgi:membrane protein
MKALLIAEYERFIKSKKYLTPIIYLVICIVGALRARIDTVYIQTFPSFLYFTFFAQDFVDGNLVNADIMRLLPVKPQSRVNILFLETGIYNLVLVLGWVIYCVILGRIITPSLVPVGIILVLESIVTPDILPKKKSELSYFEHIMMVVMLVCSYWGFITQTTLDKGICFLFFASLLIVLTYFSSIRILKTKNNF